MIVPKWIIAAHDNTSTTTISAFTADSAWGKFCVQYFGPLKPARVDYSIRAAPETVAPKAKQCVLFTGMGCLPGQLDLFE